MKWMRNMVNVILNRSRLGEFVDKTKWSQACKFSHHSNCYNKKKICQCFCHQQKESTYV